ncbi:DUF397 domain-containing protein [Streptosporangium sp. NBC_01469]|uniref:DUF397 domain-containing protein n=1 Tax=Streptosporangium sp. NBC_01469 TaxID=2903898 RepID=UPI002E2845D1|nr:DUF397 domain-containing protein [Streptosporangium sp. NBC_01469]
MDLSNATWVKSSFSGDNGGNCVEVANLRDTADHPDLIAVRDSKDPEGPKLLFTPTKWNAFLNGVKADEFGG